MAKVNDQKIKGMAPGEQITEALTGRNAGAIVIRKKSDTSSPLAYFRYFFEGKRQFLAIGSYKAAAKSAGLSLAEIRSAALKYSSMLAENPDLKSHLEQMRIDEANERTESARLKIIESSKGTFRQLFLSYIADRAAAGVRPDQVRDLTNIMIKNIDPFTELVGMRARDIQPAHINQILSKMVERGVLRQTAKVRSFLMAAFNYGMQKDNQIGSAEPVTFDIQANPVTPVTFNAEHKRIINKAGTRAMNEAELKQFYNTIDQDVEGVSFAMAQLLKMVVATGGQRIEQLTREPWSSYSDDHIRLIDAKGRGADERVHYVPLTGRSTAILHAVADVTANHSHPFSHLKDKHFHVSAFSWAVKKWLKSEHAFVDGQPFKPFTPRDLRRTMAQLMQKHGISNEASDELQSHGMNGLVARHYRNNPEASVPSKVKTLAALDRILDRILDGKEAESSNVINFTNSYK